MSNKVYVGDVGTEIILNCGQDLTGATGVQIKVKKPDLTTTTWTASVYNNNYIKYVIQTNDLDQAGIYYLQASLTLGAWSGLGETAMLKVHSAYD